MISLELCFLCDFRLRFFELLAYLCCECRVLLELLELAIMGVPTALSSRRVTSSAALGGCASHETVTPPSDDGRNEDSPKPNDYRRVFEQGNKEGKGSSFIAL